jgi:hypothetical protein
MGALDGGWTGFAKSEEADLAMAPTVSSIGTAGSTRCW